jgi:8-oxo-dGTP diphosphatase
MTKSFFLCVDGILIQNRKVFLVKRNVEPFKGFWHVVGGHVDDNETLKDALRREFKEETNLDVDVGGIVGGRMEETFDRVKIIVAFEVTAARGEVKLNNENIDYGWFERLPDRVVFDYSGVLKQLNSKCR